MNLAIFLPNWVGDAVMATPALRALRTRYPDAHLVGVLRPNVAGVLEGSPWLDSLLFLDTKGPWGQRWPAVAWRLRRYRPELAVLFPNSFRTGIVAWLGGCRRRIGYRRYGRDLFLTDGLDPLRGPNGKRTPSPVLDAFNKLAEAAGCPNPGHQMELFTTPADESAADALWQREGLHRFREVICLNSGGAFGSAKHWPNEHFAALARRLADERGSGVLVLCGPAERDLARHIASLACRPSVRTAAESSPSLGLTKACIRRADLLITTDSGPRHFAAAFDRPVVSLFGPTHIAWTETYHPRAVHLQKQVECGPCQLRVCPLDHRCMKLLTPDEVYRAAVVLLDTASLPFSRELPASAPPALAGDSRLNEEENGSPERKAS
jgi:heptosyltransferase-2